jgi:hypothetical protein
MALSSQELRELCTTKEWAIILASQPGTVEKLSQADLKKHASNAQKLVSKWQDLSRSQDRTESRKSGSPNLDSRSHEKHQAFKEALGTFQGALKSAPTAPAAAAAGKPTSKTRGIEARSQRRSTRKALSNVKQSLNRSAKPATARTAPVATPNPTADPAPTKVTATAKKVATKKTATKKTATKKPAAKTAAATKLAAQRKKRAAALAQAASSNSVAPATKKPPKAIKAKGSPAAQTSLAGKVKSTRTAIAVRTNKIAGHVSGKGKRAQGKRDARGR